MNSPTSTAPTAPALPLFTAAAANVSLRQVDLNLFRVFEAVLKHRSITGASRDLYLTPSAVSHALSRLRAVLSDKLFVAGDTGMEPTARALELAPHVRGGLERIDAALTGQSFVPANARRTFRIAASDYGTQTVLPRLMARLGSSAPHIDLRVFPLNRPDAMRQLDEGRIDLAISWFADLASNIRRHVLATDSEAIIVRPGHPLTRASVTVPRLLDYPHVVVELTGSAAPARSGYIDEAGVSRRVWLEHLLLEQRQEGRHAGRAAVSVPHYASVIPLVQASDMVATMPLSMVAPAVANGSVVLLKLPYEPHQQSLEAIWLQSAETDAGLRWLIGEIIEAMAGDQAPPHSRDATRAA